VLCSSVTLSFYYIQIAWEKSLSVLEIGLYLAVSFLAAAAGAFYAEKLEKRFGESLILKISPAILALSVFAMYFTDWALLPFCIMNVLETVVFVATRDYINRIIPSDRRATILSFESMMFSVAMILIFPLFGFISDFLDIKNTFLLLGALLLAMSAVNHKLANGRYSRRELKQE
jgi:MFS family permease